MRWLERLRDPRGEYRARVRIGVVCFAAGALLMGGIWGASSLGEDAGQAGSRLGPVGAAPDIGHAPPSAAAPETTGPAASDFPDGGGRPGGDAERDKPGPEQGQATIALPDPVACPRDPTVPVDDAGSLQAALDAARPGDVIGLAPGRYLGKFTTTASGTEADPILLCGTADAILDGDNVRGGYVLHLDGAKYWQLVGFTVTNGQKGVMADGTVGSVITGLNVHSIGDEGIHLRKFSTDNLVEANTISNTGLRREKFGEGVYVGTATSNWCTITACQPDTSDRNTIRGNSIYATTAEAVDLKEGTSDGIVEGNRFDGAALSGADSWVDAKGRDWLIRGNTGINSTQDGFQTHEVEDGWGTGNRFSNNSATVNGPGFGYSLTPVLGNTVDCSNTAANAAEGFSNVPCTG